MNFNRINRSTHRWASIAIAIPLLVIVVTGILLLLKKEVEYLQPASAKGTYRQPSISFEQVLAIAKTVKQAEIDSWQAIDRLDVRPNKGIIKIRAKSHWEIQIDATTGEILKTAFRRSDIIEQLHDASYWQDKANLWFTLPIAVVLLLIAITGIVLFFLPYYRRYQNQKRLNSLD
tara:strand:- start:1697 stop:2221 length:525 start_codon:yes stop_codon:yes gene_type:complete